MVRPIRTIVCAIVAAVAACAAVEVPLPKEIAVVQPATSVPKEQAAFSGKWVGRWDNVLDSVLVVEEVTPMAALVVYAYGVAPERGISRAGWTRVQAHFEGPDLVVPLNNGREARYHMQDSQSLVATFTYTNPVRSYPGIMKRAAN